MTAIVGPAKVSSVGPILRDHHATMALAGTAAHDIEEPREILGPLQTVQITDLRERLATYLEEVARGRALTVVSSGRFAATLISPREFGRLRRLHRAVSWFAAAGLDLDSADEREIAAFVGDYRAGSRTGSAVG